MTAKPHDHDTRVAGIVENAIHQAMSGDWETARDDAARRIALLSPLQGGVVEQLVATVQAMFDEYMLDECCDYTKINRFIEIAQEQARAARPQPLQGEKP
jgi:hypothetical protein